MTLAYLPQRKAIDRYIKRFTELGMSGGKAPAAKPRTWPFVPHDDLVKDSARLLEVLAALDGLCEASMVLEVDIQVEPDERTIRRVSTLALHLVGFDAEQALIEHADFLKTLGKGQQKRDLPTQELFEMLVYVTRALIGACPIQKLEDLARQRREFDWCERSRRAYETLSAFLRRHDPEREKTRTGIIDAFKQGRISLTEAADYLGMNSGDAIDYLESKGACRDLETIRLSDEERAAVLERIGRDRERQRTRDEVHADARRSTISNMRLEGVDARSCLPTKNE